MSRPKVHHGERVTTAVRLPVALHERLKATAEDRDVSVNWLINRGVNSPSGAISLRPVQEAPGLHPGGFFSDHRPHATQTDLALEILHPNPNRADTSD